MSKATHRHTLLTTSTLEAVPLIPAFLLDGGFVAHAGPRTTTPDNWTATKSGAWATAANWSAGIPDGSNDATIATAGTYTVTISSAASAASLTINDANATVTDSAALSLAGSLAITAGKFVLSSNLSGATVSIGAGGKFVASGGTLSSVSYQGTLDLSATSAALSLSGSNSFSGTGGAGAATINVTGTSSTLNTDGTQTLDNATVNLGNAAGNAVLYEQAFGNAATLTLGSHLNLVQAGKYAAIYIDEQNAGNTLVNAGTITAAIAGGTMSIQGPYAGDIFTNTGSIVIGTNATLLLDTNVTTGGLGHFSTTGGGVLQLGGSFALSNAGATLALGSTDVLSLSGTITGGTITDAGGGLLATGGTLSGVTYQGTLSLGASNSLYVTGGLNVSNGGSAGVINDTGNGSYLYFYDNQTIDNATLNLGNNAGIAYLYEYSSAGAATLTLGTHLNLVQSGKGARIYVDQQNAGNTLVNAGTITAAISGGDLYVSGPYTGDVFTNTGTIVASNNDRVDLQVNVTTGGLGHFSTATGGLLQLDGGYTLSNTGATLNLGSADQLSLAGTIVGGTVNDAGSGLLAANGTLIGVTYQGTLSLGSSATLNITSGLNVSNGGNAGVINDTGNGSSLYLYDNQTIDNATLNIGNNSSFSYLYEYSSGAAATLTLGSHLNLVQSGKLARIYIDQQNIGNTLINAGTITAATSGGDLTVYGQYTGDVFTNTGAIAVSNNDTVDLVTNVTTGGLGHFTTATGGVLQLDSGYTLNNTGATLTLGSTQQLTLAGTVAGGTIIDLGNGLQAAGGTLAGASYQGTLSLATNTSLSAVGGLNVSSAGGAGVINMNSGSTLIISGGLNISSGGGTGIINDSASNSNLYFYDNQTIDNATINLGNNGGFAYLYEYSSAGGSEATLTLGSHLNLVQSGKLARIYIDQQNIGNTLINAGTITAATSGGDLTVNGQYTGDVFTNTGAIAVSNNDTVDLATNVTTGGLGQFSTATGGALQLDSGYTLNNTGATLSLGAADQLTLAGTIAGGTIVDSGSGLQAAGGTLASVSYQGTLSLATNTSLNAIGGLNVSSNGGAGVINMNGGSSLSIAGGLNISGGGGTGVINDNASSSTLYFYDNQTIDNATINLGNNNGVSFIYEYSTGGTATLTLGSHLNLVQSGKLARIYIDQQNIGNTLINAGTITAATSGGDLTVYGQYTGDVFANTGTIAVSNNDTVDLATNVTTGGLGQFSTATGGALQLDASYTLSNAGATLSLGTADQLTLAGTITGGTIVDSGNGLQAASGTLTGVTYQGTLSLGASSSLSISGGLNIGGGGGAGVINDTGNGAGLYLYNKQTIDNATLNLGNSTGYSSLFEYTSAGAATLTLGSNLSLVQSGRYARIYVDQQNTGNTLINAGTITANNSGGSLAIQSPYTKDKFTNTGSLLATTGGTLDLSTAQMTNLVGGTLTGGRFEADAGSVIELVNNAAVATASATITLSGAGSAIQALNTTTGKQVLLDSKLTTISSTGSLALLAGRNFATSAAFTDSGALQLGGGTFTSAGGLTVGTGAHLSGFGAVAAAVINAGLIEATTGTLAVTGAITGSGALQIDASATLDLQSSSSNTETVTFAGQGGTLRLDTPATFAGLIAGFAAGDNVSLGTLTTTAATLNGTSLAITLTGGTVLNETLTAAATGERIGVSADGHTLTAYRFAAGAAHTPEPIAFGNHHTGDLATQALTLTNTAAADGFSEKLDAAFTAATAGVTDAGTLLGLAAGQSSSAALSVGLNTSTAGAIAGTATLSLSTDGAGIDIGSPLALGTQTVNVTGAVFNYAAGQAANAGTVALGNTHVGAGLSGFLGLTNTAAPGAYSEGLDAALTTTAAGATASGTIANLAAGAVSSTSLAVGLLAAGAGALSATATLTLASDGATTSGLGTTALASQAVTITGAAYNYAAAALAAPTINLGAVHVGGLASATLGLTNAAAAGAYSEALDASFTGATGALSASGSLALLTAGSTDAAHLLLSLSTAAAGAQSGTATLSLASDGAGTSGLGITALASQTVTVSASVYGYAAASAATMLALGNIHVGGTASALLALSNSAAANGYSEALDAQFANATGIFAATGSLSGLAAGVANATALGASFTTGTAGAYTGTATLSLSSDGTGTSGLGITALSPQTIALSGAAYNYAVASLPSQMVNLGVLHVGDATRLALALGNAAASGAYSESLDASFSTLTGAALASGSFSGLLAGGTDTSHLLVGLNTTATGALSGTALLSLISDGAGTSGLGTTALASETVTLTGIVDNYALAAFTDGTGPALVATGANSFSVNLGAAVHGGAALSLSLGALNAATGLADLLGGTLSVTGGGGFTNTGFGTFSGLGAQQSELGQSVSLATSTSGAFSETIVLTASGSNASGYTGPAQTETLTITGTITPSGNGGTYTLAVGPNVITGADGNDTFIAIAGSLNSRDQLTGGAGTNTLALNGGGYFDIGAPTVFSNIPNIAATEGQAAAKSAPDTRQTLFLRNGTNETVVVAAGTAAAGNANAEAFTLYGGNGADTITLASGADHVFLAGGTDTITLGGAANAVTAGSGAATIAGAIGSAGAAIIGNAAAFTTLTITTAGTGTLNAADTYLAVNLAASSKLALGALSFITVNGGAGSDIITAGGASQTLIGGVKDVLTGATAGADTFLGSSAALNGDTLGNWTAGDVLDITDMNSATLHALTFAKGKLAVSDGTHSDTLTVTPVKGGTLSLTNFTVIGSDGHGGTLIGFHS